MLVPWSSEVQVLLGGLTRWEESGRMRPGWRWRRVVRVVKMGGKEYSGRGDCGCLSSSYPVVK